MAGPTIRAVFLDAGNTLFTERQPRPEIYRLVAQAHGGTAEAGESLEAMEQAFADVPSSVDGNFRYSLGWFRTFNEQVLDALRVPEAKRQAAHEELLATFESDETYRLFPEVRETLEDLANRGMVVGVVSNWSERLPLLLKKLGIDSLLEFIVASAEIKSEKPDRAIFDRALFRAGVPAEETLHVGDHMDRDVRGALRAGLRAALLDRAAEENGTHDGVPVLTDLRGVLPLVCLPAHASRD